MKAQIKKVTHQQLADHLGRSKSTVSKYPKEKLKLMLVGLATLRERKQNDTYTKGK